jgi:hypothetical protein
MRFRFDCLIKTGFKTKNGIGHCLVQTVGADSISALFGADMESAPTQYVAERMIKAKKIHAIEIIK